MMVSHPLGAGDPSLRRVYARLPVARPGQEKKGDPLSQLMATNPLGAGDPLLWRAYARSPVARLIANLFQGILAIDAGSF